MVEKSGKAKLVKQAMKRRCESLIHDIMNKKRDLLKRPVTQFIADPAMKQNVDAILNFMSGANR